jgi:hypothetical protein
MIFKSLEKFDGIIEKIVDERIKGDKTTSIVIYLKKGFVSSDDMEKNILKCRNVKECIVELKKVVEKPTKKSRGGKREGSGRPLKKVVRKSSISIKCTPEEKERIIEKFKLVKEHHNFESIAEAILYQFNKI